MFFLLLLVGPILAQSPIRLDDTFTYPSNPSGIQFSVGSRWSSYAAGQAYNNTYTATNSSGANIILSFKGKSIKYYGDRDPLGGVASIRLDGAATNVSLGATNGYQTQQQLWGADGLDGGDHQVIVSRRRGLFGIDFFEIVPNADGDVKAEHLGPGASSVLHALVVDDTDSSITYSGNGWQPKGSTPDRTIYLQGSSHTTRYPGDTCTFTFSGTAVWFFTDYSLGNAVVAISVDGRAPDVVDTAPTNATNSRSQRLAWSKTDLSDGTHRVSVTHAGIAGTWATIDFFKYTPTSATSTTVSVPLAVSPASTTVQASSSSVTSSAGGAIAGGVIGGVMGVIFVALGVLAFVRTRPSRETKE